MELELDQPLPYEAARRWENSSVICPVDDGSFVVTLNGAPHECGVSHERALSVRSSLLYNEWEIL